MVWFTENGRESGYSHSLGAQHGRNNTEHAAALVVQARCSHYLATRCFVLLVTFLLPLHVPSDERAACVCHKAGGPRGKDPVEDRRSQRCFCLVRKALDELKKLCLLLAWEC